MKITVNMKEVKTLSSYRTTLKLLLKCYTVCLPDYYCEYIDTLIPPHKNRVSSLGTTMDQYT